MKLFTFPKKDRNDDEDKMIGRALVRAMKDSDAGECPPLEDIAALVDDNMKGNEKDALMKHLARCDKCYEVYSMTYEMTHEGEKEKKTANDKKHSWTFVSYALAASIAVAFISVYLINKNPLSLLGTMFADRNAPEVGLMRGPAVDAKTVGKYYAVVIGINRYDDSKWVELKTAVNDAKEITRILHDQYGFETEFLQNATRQEIFETIARVRKDLHEEDSLLIYYGGHGTFDKKANKGYWLPRDARSDNYGSWIQADDITAELNRNPARHVLVVADSCYSGALTRSGFTTRKDWNESNYDRYVNEMEKGRSRTLMASGGNEPVADGSGDGRHSVFASAFIKALEKADKQAFTAVDLFQIKIAQAVAGNSKQTPMYDFIKESGHEYGDFVFRSTVNRPSQETTTIAAKSATNRGENASQATDAKREGAVGSGADIDWETGMEFVFVKGGCYDMGDSGAEGDSDETPVHEVCVDDFYMGKYVVTQGQWKKIMGEDNNPSRFRNCGDECPVERVSWIQAKNFINELNKRSERNYRLPTEAEWEYAARSGGKRDTWAGTSNDKELVRYAWYTDNAQGGTRPVGIMKPNGLELYDMSGLVWQWVSDWYDEDYYKRSPEKNPENKQKGDGVKVVRGGAWYNDAWYIRTTYREWSDPNRATNSFGFRLVMPMR